MQRSNPTILILFCTLIVAVLGGVSLAKGGLYLARHEGDVLHTLDILLRMSAGEIPYLDFSTPIGIWAFSPIVVFLDQGMGVGLSIIYGQILVALCLLPAVVWLAYSRFSTLGGIAVALVILALPLALVHGETIVSNSISMHYNRWAWALCYIVVLIVVLPLNSATRGTVDGVILGAAMAALVLIKITFAVALVLPVLAALALHRQGRVFLVSLATVAVIFAGVTWRFGSTFWSAYIFELLEVMSSEVRPSPGESLAYVVSAPAYIGATLVALAGVVLLRQARVQTGGLLLLLLLPAFQFVTYQNWGNDPQWLILLAILLLALRPGPALVNGLGWNLRNALTMLAVGALAFGTPSFVNVLLSPLKHASLEISGYTPVLPRATLHSDLQTMKVRANNVTEIRPVKGFTYTGFDPAGLAIAAEPTLLLSEVLPMCNLDVGMISWLDRISQQLQVSGISQGKHLFVADVLSGHWMFGDTKPLRGGAPWHYGGLSGIEQAEFLLVPLCPINLLNRKLVLKAISERQDLELKEVERTDLYVLLEIRSVE